MPGGGTIAYVMIKISQVETLLCSGGWRPWMFIRIRTESGITGYSECTESFGSLPAIRTCIADLGNRLEGRTFLSVEAVFWELYRLTRQSCGGVVQKAIAGIENALLDIKAKSLGVPVCELLGGPLRQSLPVYWSHCGSTRVRSHQHIGEPPLRTFNDVSALGAEVVSKGYRAFKTNLILLGESEPTVLMQGYRDKPGDCALDLSSPLREQIVSLLRAFREGAGTDCEIMIDFNAHFRADGNLRLARALEPFDLAWIEVDSLDAAALAELKRRVTIPLASCENILGARALRPFLEARAADVVVVDLLWNGLWQASKMAHLAETFDLNIAIHNHYSPLATLMAAQFAMAIANVNYVEIDVDDVPWHTEIVTEAPVVEGGLLHVPEAAGWGADLAEAVIAAHPWNP